MLMLSDSAIPRDPPKFIHPTIIFIIALLIPLLLGLTLRLLPLTLPFVDDEVGFRIDGPLRVSLTEKITRENPTLAQREQAVLVERAFQRATESSDYRSLRAGAARFYRNAVKDDEGWYLPSNGAYQWYRDASLSLSPLSTLSTSRSDYAFLLRLASSLFSPRSVVLFTPVFLALVGIVLFFFVARFFTPSLFGRFFAATLAAMHPLFLAMTLPGSGSEAFFVVGLLVVLMLALASFFAPSFFRRCAAGAGAVLIAGLVMLDYVRAVPTPPLIPPLASFSLSAWISQYHSLILLAGLAGIAVLFVSGRRWQGVLAASLFVVGILFSLGPNGTSLPFFSILVLASAAAIGYACDWCALFARAHLHVPALAGQVIAGILLLLIFVPQILTMPDLRPAYDDEWHAVVREATSNIPSDARIAAWGDEAFITVVSERRVVSDSPVGRYWLARALAANETESVAIFRMLACTEEPLPVGSKLSPPDHSCSPSPFSPSPFLLVVDENILQDAPAWSRLGRWDFEKAALWDAYHAGEDTVALMRTFNTLNYSADEQRETRKRLGLLLSEDEARAWIGAASSYGGEAVCDTSGQCTLATAARAIVFQLNGRDVTVTNTRAKKQPASVVWVDESGFHERANSGDTAAFSVGIVQKKNETRLALIDPTLTHSVATRLLFYNASGLPSFTPLATSRSLTGGDITIWRVLLQ